MFELCSVFTISTNRDNMEQKKIKIFAYDTNIKIKDYYQTLTDNNKTDELMDYLKQGFQIHGCMNRHREGTNIVEGYVVLRKC